jgi:hypothetical protein
LSGFFGPTPIWQWRKAYGFTDGYGQSGEIEFIKALTAVDPYSSDHAQMMVSVLIRRTVLTPPDPRFQPFSFGSVDLVDETGHDYTLGGCPYGDCPPEADGGDLQWEGTTVFAASQHLWVRVLDPSGVQELGLLPLY